MAFEIRKIRTPQGKKKLAREREEYFRLMEQGVSSREACRIVGINRRTGKRWRNGTNATKNRPAQPAHRVRAERVVSSSRHLTQEERLYIADRVREKASVRKIAAELERSPSTISREICRNRHPANGQYRPYAAQARAESRLPRPKPGKIAQNTELREFIQDHLDKRWSPEQICQALRRHFPDRPELHVVHETILQHFTFQGRENCGGTWPSTLQRARAGARPDGQAQQRQAPLSRPMVMINDRPAEAEDRAVAGHWEGDLIIGKDGASTIGTLVERSTRYVKLLHLPNGRGTELVRDALVGAVTMLPAHLKPSLTWDQGTEMGRHHEFTVAPDVPVYFCDPASPWQRGLNENTNGLLRQYFPKGTDLSVHHRNQLEAVAAELNNRPRKTLGWETPAERLSTLLATA
uniref:Tnp n=1 Tax=Streptomyces chattanoogensis TaxID=66876 RepID=F1CLC0_9ACTN|nr:Tnp [Streptomyces chattanoogensis]